MILTLLIFACSENNPILKDIGGSHDVSNIDLPSSDLSDKGRDTTRRDVTKGLEDISTQDMAPTLSNAIALTNVALTFDDVSVNHAIEIANNALPFLSASYHLGDPTLRYLHLDSIIENGELIVSRNDDSPIIGESISISGQVVAFDPARFRVQCTAFRTGKEVVDIAIDPVDVDRSFLNFWSRIATGSNNKDVAYISARFNIGNEITLERGSPAGSVNGHLCVTQSLGDTFSVQHLLSKIPEGETEVLVPIDSVDLSRSIVFVSHQATRGESKPGYSQVSCELQTSAVRCLRGLSEYEISDIRIQVVSFKDRTTVARFHVVIEDGVKESRLDLPAVDQRSVVFGPIGVLGEVATDGMEKADVPSSHVEAVVEKDGVLFKRGEPWTGRLEFFPQIVNW